MKRLAELVLGLASMFSISLSPASESASAALSYLRAGMDEFHNRFPVYDDVSSPGNHFHAYAKILDQNAAVNINSSFADSPFSGATSIRCVFNNTTGTNFGGFYFLNGILPPGATEPQLNFGDHPNAGLAITGATALTFWARGETGAEKIEVFMGGVGRDPQTGMPTMPFPDSTPVVKTPLITLTTEWKQFRIDLVGKDLSYVLGGFGWVANAPNNPNGAVFYLDNIQYELSPTGRDQRLNEPRFIRSFTTKSVQPDPFDDNKDDDIDLALRNTAFTYDNALALLAFLVEDNEDGIRRAKLIGDALVYASEHDRSFSDGRLRSAYAAGDISLPPGWVPNGRVGTVPVPGFYDERQQKFFEVEQGAVDIGNNAWAMIALLALYQRTQEPAYLDTARRLGEFIHTFRNDVGRFRGFQGGLNDPEGLMPTRRPWASTEHNLDVHASFTVMFQLTGEQRWQADADHARHFVEGIFDPQKGCFLTGTIDPDTRNETPGQLPLDAQSWSVLALRDVIILHPIEILDCAERNHFTTQDGFTGFDFNEDKDGVWFEGTAQMAVAYALAGESAKAEASRQELRRAQANDPFGDGHGVAAASHDGVSSGFGFKLFRRLHVGATSWLIFAELERNPYYVEPSVEPPVAPPVFCAGRVATIVGTPLNDTVFATAGPDVIAGRGGNDVINGFGGDDVICGGSGNDSIIGGHGRDRLYGEGGRDNLRGNSGRDRIEGGSGNDKMNGGTGTDICKGGSGTDTATACENVTRVP